ncbi:MAG: hypothetical protein KC466_10225 [Myxococcales bacterium]|nr:hypothetical protein [Myxococcales bacterium]
MNIGIFRFADPIEGDKHGEDTTMKASMTPRNILIFLASIGLFQVTIAPPPPAVASGMIPDDLREIWSDYLIDNWAKSDANLPLFNSARINRVISRRTVCEGAPQKEPIDSTGPTSPHVCKDPTGATDDLVAYYDVEFHTLYWEYELEQLEAACKASGAATSEACRTQHQVVTKFKVNSIPASTDDPGGDPNVMMQRSAQAHQAWECAKCDEVLDPGTPNKPVAVIEAFGALVVPAAAVGTGAANLPVLVAVGFGNFAGKVEEAATFALRNNAAVLVVNAPGETGNTGEYEPSSLFVADDVSWAKTMDLADRVRIACDPDALPQGSRPPQPCVGFRDLTNWDWKGTDWSSAWSALNLALFQEADGAIATNPMPNLGPIEFQSSEFHDLVDTDPDPRDSWFFRAAFAVMRGITFVEKMDAGSGTAPGVPLDGGVFDYGLVDSTRVALGGTSRGGIVAYMVNGVDDRVNAMIVSGTGGLFPASYDDNALHVTASTTDAYGNPAAPAAGMCVYPTTPPAPGDFVNPFRPTGDAFVASEVGEIDERYWNVDCAATPFACEHEEFGSWAPVRFAFF